MYIYIEYLISSTLRYSYFCLYLCKYALTKPRKHNYRYNIYRLKYLYFHRLKWLINLIIITKRVSPSLKHIMNPRKDSPLKSLYEDIWLFTLWLDVINLKYIYYVFPKPRVFPPPFWDVGFRQGLLAIMIVTWL